MKAFFIFIMFLRFTCDVSSAQVNLVLNPSFEQHDSCYNHYDNIRDAVNWTSLDSNWSPALRGILGVPEYCNACMSSSLASVGGVPESGRYYQYPRSGNGMAQVVMFNNELDGGFYYERDYLQGHLSMPLIAGYS